MESKHVSTSREKDKFCLVLAVPYLGHCLSLS